MQYKWLSQTEKNNNFNISKIFSLFKQYFKRQCHQTSMAFLFEGLLE